MKRPSAVNKAVVAIWFTLGLSVLGEGLNRYSGLTTTTHLVITLVLYALFALLPYRIGARRNWARYAYAVLVLLSVGQLFAPSQAGTLFDILAARIGLPFEAFALVMLFRRESTNWFEPE